MKLYPVVSMCDSMTAAPPELKTKLENNPYEVIDLFTLPSSDEEKEEKDKLKDKGNTATADTTTKVQPINRISERKAQLRQEILNFGLGCLPTSKESSAIQQIVKIIAEVARRLFPNCCVKLFGSQATGLALPSSDLDIVILDNGPEIFAPLEKFTNAERHEIMAKLKNMDYCLQGYTVDKGKLIPAKIPILRVQMDNTMDHCYRVDISFGVRNACHAVELIQNYFLANPAIQPLFLILKSLLKLDKLNEVYRGGISSFVLFNLVVAHLMMEGMFVFPSTNHPNSLQSTSQHQLKSLEELLLSITLPLEDLLLSFLHRFGNWDPTVAVSILENGVTSVSSIKDAIPGRILHVEDPQAPGKDASRGTFDMPKILVTFQKATEKLERELSNIQPKSRVCPFFCLDSNIENESKGTFILESIIPCANMVPSLYHKRQKRQAKGYFTEEISHKSRRRKTR